MPLSPPVAAGAAPPSASPALAHWRELHASGDIQFAPLPEWHQPPPPDWLMALGRFLDRLFRPLAQALGGAWPFVKWALIALFVAAVLAILVQLALPLLRRRRVKPSDAPETIWTPARAEAEALLADADRLADEGRFDEAAHLLLRRGVAQIAAVRPGWLAPASTAREIATLPQLPALARSAFTEIARRVEVSRFALRPLGLEDWRAARAAYADFALQRLDAGAAV